MSEPLAEPGRVRDLAVAIATERQPTVLCAHRENLAPALAAICGYLGADSAGRAGRCGPGQGRLLGPAYR